MTVLRNLAIAGVAVLALSATACGNKTVTSQPAANTPTSIAASGTGSGNAAASPAAAASEDLSPGVVPDDTQLNDVDQMLRDIESDLNTADQEATTPEGDPTA